VAFYDSLTALRKVPVGGGIRGNDLSGDVARRDGHLGH
jgi:hypothetical protein